MNLHVEEDEEEEEEEEESEWLIFMPNAAIKLKVFFPHKTSGWNDFCAFGRRERLCGSQRESYSGFGQRESEKSVWTAGPAKALMCL